MITFGQVLRVNRQARGLTQTQLGELVGRSTSYISRLEGGTCRALSDLEALRYAEALELEEADTMVLVWAAVAATGKTSTARLHPALIALLVVGLVNPEKGGQLAVWAVEAQKAAEAEAKADELAERLRQLEQAS